MGVRLTFRCPFAWETPPILQSHKTSSTHTGFVCKQRWWTNLFKFSQGSFGCLCVSEKCEILLTLVHVRPRVINQSAIWQRVPLLEVSNPARVVRKRHDKCATMAMYFRRLCEVNMHESDECLHSVIIHTVPRNLPPPAVWLFFSHTSSTAEHVIKMWAQVHQSQPWSGLIGYGW